MCEDRAVESIRRAHSSGAGKSSLRANVQRHDDYFGLGLLHTRVNSPSAAGDYKDNGSSGRRAHPIAFKPRHRRPGKYAAPVRLGLQGGVHTIFKALGSGKVSDQAQCFIGCAELDRVVNRISHR